MRQAAQLSVLPESRGQERASGELVLAKFLSAIELACTEVFSEWQRQPQTVQ